MKRIELPGFTIPTLLSSILWLESEANYTRIYYQDGTNDLVTKPLNYFVQYAGLIRIHRSIMVNLMHAQALVRPTRRSVCVELSTGKTLTVSRSYQPLMTNLLSRAIHNEQPSTGSHNGVLSTQDT